MQKPFFKIIIKHVVIIILLSLIAISLYLFKVPCLFRFITGIPCPSCGMTRAFLSFLSLDFASSFAYHPLLIPSLFTIFLALHINVKSFHLNKKFCNIYFYIFIAVLFVVYIFRLTKGTIM